jgi:hypothetical protein
MAEIRPLFLLSQPRAGSTFVQRVLAAHPSISTVSEPWVLLPLLYSLRDGGVRAVYGHHQLVRAIEDFSQQLPRGMEDYLEEVRAFALRLYQKAAADGSGFFLDKTPRYALASEDLFRVFPEGKFVFLWRNPLSVAASLIRTSGQGHWNLDLWDVDLYDGLANLVSSYEARQRDVVAVRYEDLVTPGDSEWERIFRYLDLQFDPEILHRFRDVRLEGRLGDPIGTRRYSTVSTEPVSKWKTTLANPIRRRWARRYLRWIGPTRLSTMGYDFDPLVRELDEIPTTGRYLGSDTLRIAYGRLTYGRGHRWRGRVASGR